jgi:hypothetical protein
MPRDTWILSGYAITIEAEQVHSVKIDHELRLDLCLMVRCLFAAMHSRQKGPTV